MTPEQRSRYYRNLKAVDDIRKDILRKEQEKRDREAQAHEELRLTLIDIALTPVQMKDWSEPSRTVCHCGTVHYSDESCSVCRSEHYYDRRHI